MARLDRDRFEQLVREHHSAVYRSALRVLRNDGDAADTTQDVFVRALIGKLPLERATERATLCWLATRLALNALRGARRRHRHESLAVMPSEPITPVQHATDAELRRTVHRMVDELPEHLRLPLVLRYQDDLTFAALGSALTISESTAHERVQQALGRLRQQLARLGLTAVPSLPELVAAAEAAIPPSGLETRLLSLGGAVPSVAPVVLKAAGVVATLSCVVAVTVVSFGRLQREGEPSGPAEQRTAALAAGASHDDAGQDPATTRPASPLRTPVVSVTSESGVVGTQRDPAPPAQVMFTGTVHDASAAPVGSARVVAVAAGGLKPFEIAATTTDAAGAFRLVVASMPVPATKIRIQVLENTNVLLQTDELALASSGTDREPLRLHLPEAAGVLGSRFELAVTVRDAGGALLEGVPVALYGETSPHARPGQSRAEAEGTTGPGGVVRLTGRKPGAKLLFADGRKLGLRAEVSELQIGRPGEHATTVALAPGGSLRGRVTALDGGDLEWANVWLEDEKTLLYHSTKLGAGGEIVFTGLGDGPFTLHVQRHPFSPAKVRGLVASEKRVEVQLKSANDERDVGHHMAELHGRLVDADSGKVVAFTSEQVEVQRVLAGDSTLPSDRIEPPRPVQRMLDGQQHETFHRTGLDEGTWAVGAKLPGYARCVQLFDVRAGEMRTGLELRLVRGAKVAGRVVDAAGKPVPEAFVFVTGIGGRADAVVAGWDAEKQRGQRQPGAAAPASLSCSARAAADGTFVLEGVPPATRIRVVAVAKGHAPALGAPLQLRAGEAVAECELRLPPR